MKIFSILLRKFERTSPPNWWVYILGLIRTVGRNPCGFDNQGVKTAGVFTYTAGYGIGTILRMSLASDGYHPEGHIMNL